jgi:hypothetical protein
MRSRKLLGLFSGLCALLRLAYSGEALDERVQLTGVLRVQWSDAQGAQGSDGFSLGLARIGARFRADEQTTRANCRGVRLWRGRALCRTCGRFPNLAAQRKDNGRRRADFGAPVLRCA